MRFAEMDRNRDGRISRNEWQGNDQSFRVNDWNGDGVLAGDEVRAGGGFDDWTARGFANLDENRDGRITSNEWFFDRTDFNRADHNRDGIVSRSEFLNNARVDNDREDAFLELDYDRDGRISRGEWRGGIAEFASRDTNRDNYLSQREMLGNDQFTTLDLNGDRLLTRNEWRTDLGDFNRLDTNNDRRISPQEFRNEPAATRRSQAYRSGYERGQIEGRQAGREDRALRNTWDLEGQRELETADSGYVSQVGSRTEYQAGYREGFRQAYGDGFRSQ